MNREKIVEQLSQWLDGELTEADIAAVQQHLTEDAATRHLYEQMQQVDTHLRQLTFEIVAPTNGFGERFAKRMQQYHTLQRRRVGLASFALLCGTIIFALFFIVGVTEWLSLLLLLDVSTLQQLQITLIESINTVYSLLNLGEVVLKAGLIILRQPLFWVTATLALMMTGAWVVLMQQLYYQPSRISAS